MKLSMPQKAIPIISGQVDEIFMEVQSYVKKNTTLICALVILALCAYGFELFNFNLTIDEEIHATYSEPVFGWIEEGRWGMYLLNKFVIPYTVMPFVPLFIALVFHICAILLMLDAWQVTDIQDQIIVGAVSITFPIMAYMYMFSTINYGIGIGLFCVALTLYIYLKKDGAGKLLAIIPASFAIAIYQGFILALAAIFLVHIISSVIWSRKQTLIDLMGIAGLLFTSAAIYYLMQLILISVFKTTPSSYISNAFDLPFLWKNFYSVLSQIIVYFVLPIYSGEKRFYALNISLLDVVMLVSLLGIIINITHSKSSRPNKFLAIVFIPILLIIPFSSGFLMHGWMSLRFLIALAIVIPGIVKLGIQDSPMRIKPLLAILVWLCVFQFIMSTNHLFASSHLALQADRVLSTNLIMRIEDAKAAAGVEDLNYMEVIGYYSRPPTELMPKMEYFGTSFFEWGNTSRILMFLQTLGINDLEPLPLNEKGRMIEIANSMPVWPQKGSVKVVGDAVLVKFGPYSDAQRQIICSNEQNRQMIQIEVFCKQ